MTLGGDIDYDGVLPGGRANKLQLGGEVVVTTRDNNFTMSFQPDQTIKIFEFVSSTGWRGRNISFDLIEGEDVLTRVRGAQPFRSHLKNVGADIASPENDRHLRTHFDEMKIKSNFQSDPQIWDLGIKGIELNSDDFPSSGTHVQSAEGTAQVTQYKDGSLEFLITSPETAISTDNVQVTDLLLKSTVDPKVFLLIIKRVPFSSKAKKSRHCQWRGRQDCKTAS